jgi:hypothetical protein
MHERLNFQNISNAYITLVRVSTGEGWNDLLDVLGQGKSLTNDCVYDPSYEDYVAAGFNPIACGNHMLSCLFFFSFLVLITLTFLNLFIAIILSGYFDAREQSKKVLNDDVLTNFTDAWS